MPALPLLPAAYTRNYAKRTGKPAFDSFDQLRLFNLLSAHAGTDLGNGYKVGKHDRNNVSTVQVHTGDPARALIEVTHDQRNNSFESAHMVGARRMQRFARTLASCGIS